LKKSEAIKLELEVNKIIAESLNNKDEIDVCLTLGGLFKVSVNEVQYLFNKKDLKLSCLKSGDFIYLNQLNDAKVQLEAILKKQSRKKLIY
jgi:hypothetical protein